MTSRPRTAKLTMAVGALASVALVLSGCAPASGGDPGVTTLKMVFEPGPEADAMSVLVDAYNEGEGKDDGIAVEITQLSRTDTFAKEAAVMSTRSSDYDIYRTASYLIAQHAPYLELSPSTNLCISLPRSIRSRSTMFSTGCRSTLATTSFITAPI